MPRQLKNALEIFQLLEKSNCRQCGEKTCLAFAGAVFLEQKKLQDCPRLSAEILAGIAPEPGHPTITAPGSEYLEHLQAAVTRLDLAAAAERVGGTFSGGQLTVKVLGKDVNVDAEGHLRAHIHINPWLAVPLLNYILSSPGLPITGQWVSLRELQEGRERYPLFHRRAEKGMQQVADVYPDLFADIVSLFSGEQVAPQFQADISVVLYPLPKVPIMICYWRPEEDLSSSLHIFFDATADRNLDVDSVFTLGTGLATMFKKFALKHGFSV